MWIHTLSLFTPSCKGTSLPGPLHARLWQCLEAGSTGLNICACTSASPGPSSDRRWLYTLEAHPVLLTTPPEALSFWVPFILTLPPSGDAQHCQDLV